MYSLEKAKWHPTPVLLPGKSHGQRSLEGCSPLGHWELDTTDFTFTFHFHALEKEMATHSSVLAWRIPGMAEPGRLPSMGSHRVGHDWSDLAAAAVCSLVTQMAKNLPAMQETQVQSLGQEDPLEKGMATHSSILAWRIPWTEEPGRLQSMGSLRVGHDWLHFNFSLFTFMHWRRKWQPTPVFLPGKSQGRGNLVGCRLWGRTESDTTEATQQQEQSYEK